jgi:Fe-S-cluster-containing hydrogenase component 2
MKTGVFFCTCGKTSSIDYKDLKKSINADIIEVLDDLCHNEGLSYIIDDIRRKDLERVLIGCNFKNRKFEDVVDDSVDITFLNLREHCGWVHEKKDATEKAKRLVDLALTVEKPLLEKLSINAGEDILVIGQRYVWPIANRLAGMADVSLLLDEPDRRMWQYDIPIHVGSVQNISNKIGDFSVEISITHPVDFEKCISCGQCLPACPKGAIDLSLGFDSSCDKCGQCTDACPVDAIDLHKEKSMIIKCGQIVASEPGWSHSRQFGVHRNDSGDCSGALLAAMDAAACTGVFRKDKLLEVYEGCASGKSEIIGCTLCESICPHDAIKRSGEKIIFDHTACMGCGACTAICPISIPRLQACPDDLVYARIDTMLQGKEKLSPAVIMFTCEMEGLQALDAAGEKHLTYQPVLPVFVPCINAVHEAHILRAFDSGAAGVVLLGCGNCKHETGRDGIMNTVNAVLNAAGLNERFALINADPKRPEAFVKELNDFIDTLTPRNIQRTPVEIKSDNKRFVLLDLTANQTTDLITNICEYSQKGEVPFGSVTIDSKCTLCSACMNMCPTEALDNRDGRIYFKYSHCIACGLCEKACPEHAIIVEKIFDAARILEPEIILFEPELVNCLACSKPFITKAALAHITEKIGKDHEALALLQYCQDCRPVKAVENLKMDHLK